MTWSRGLALAALLLAILNMFGSIKVDDPTIYLLLIALACVALPEISKVSFGKDGFTFERFQAIKQDLEALKAGTAAMMEPKVGGALPRPASTEGAALRTQVVTDVEKTSLSRSSSPGPILDEDDPQAGRWGGHAEVAGRRVRAEVTESPLRADWFNVVLTVESTDRKRPLLGSVVFHLHPTFATPRSRPVINGQATLNLVAWGSFTVGVETDEGKTQLEIDLARVPDAPAAFRQR